MQLQRCSYRGAARDDCAATEARLESRGYRGADRDSVAARELRGWELESGRTEKTEGGAGSASLLPAQIATCTAGCAHGIYTANYVAQSDLLYW